MNEDSQKEKPEQDGQDLFSQMVSQTSGMLSPMAPLGSVKPLGQVTEAQTGNPQQFAEAMQLWVADRGKEPISGRSFLTEKIRKHC